MKKKILSNQKGITLAMLLITIIIIAILGSVVISNMDIGTDIRNYNYMIADIELLESKIMTYYNKKGGIPTTGNLVTVSFSGSSRDNENYYQIDISQLYNITLNYGGGTVDNGDIYIINEQSHNVYYLKGVEYEGTTYHTYK